MKRLKFHRISLLSLAEKKAKTVSFSPKITVILGSNSVGKTCLLRSLFWTLGAEPDFHKKWVQANIYSRLEFSVDDVKYSCLRHGSSFSVYDHKNKLIKSFSSVTNGLAPYFAELFDFPIKLTDKYSHLINLPPAYMFLPYYVDQDKSWQNNWSAFSRLFQFPSGWKKALVEFHTGIHPKEYYIEKGIQDALQVEIERITAELELLKEILSNFESTFANGAFNLDSRVFEREIKELLSGCEQLKIQQDDYKRKYTEYYNHRVSLDRQIEITSNALSEVAKDVRYANKEGIEVECPTCGATYENTFEARFAIAKDAERCEELLFELKSERVDVTEKMQKLDVLFERSSGDLAKIEQLLSVKKGQLQFKDVIESEGGKQAKSVISKHREKLFTDLGKKETQIKACKTRLKQFDDKQRKSEILSTYLGAMRHALAELNVNLAESDYKELDSKVGESGSKKPRALVAYYISILHTIYKHSTSTFCPIVVDSPNQQAQDKENLPRMLAFIKDSQPPESQMVLGLESTEGIAFGGTVVELKEKESLLSSGEYERVFSEMRPFIADGIA